MKGFLSLLDHYCQDLRALLQASEKVLIRLPEERIKIIEAIEDLEKSADRLRASLPPETS